MEVVASEPLIASPSAVCWDEHGRMFVSELHGYYLAGQLDIEELNKTGNLDTQVRRVQADEKFQRAAKAGMFGSDGSIWITDYYREIIEDYSAIPRHLQQQYGVYHGHDRGRIYRLTHQNTPRAPTADMSKLSDDQTIDLSLYPATRSSAGQRTATTSRRTTGSSTATSDSGPSSPQVRLEQNRKG